MSHHHRQQAFDNTAGSRVSQASRASRVSIVSVANLPQFTEKGEINRALPKIPLRVPQKNPRRSLPPGGIPVGASGSTSNGPTPYVSPDGTPYHSMPTTPISPISQFKPPASIETETNEIHSPLGSVTPQNNVTDVEPEDEKEWVDHRQRRCRFMILVGVLAAVVIGLAVGLGIGLSKGNTNAAKNSASTGSSSTVFPAGAYSFDTYLRENSTGCTSRATTWRCFPESAAGAPSNIGSRATFYWTLQSTGPSTVYVSGTDNPFAPNFANLPATMLDANQPNERLTFAFTMNKTVTPADFGAPANRVANCTYGGTVFQATLWTRRRGGETLEPPSHPAKFAPWPGDFEVTQYKNSTIGDPMCVDKQGKGIADVQAAGGSCLCRYSSSSMT